MLRAETIQSYEQFLTLEPVWDRLPLRSDGGLPFLTFEWFNALWQESDDGDIMAIVVFDGVAPAAIVPLMRMKKVQWRLFPLNALAFAANGHSFRAGLILERLDGRIVDFILEYGAAAGLGLDLVQFDFLEKDSAVYSLLKEALARKGVRYMETGGGHSPYIAAEGGWEQFVRAQSNDTRRKLAFLEGFCRRNGRCEIVQYASRDFCAGLEKMRAVCGRVRRHENRMPVGGRGTDAAFHLSFVETAARRGWVNIRILQIDSVPAAFAYTIVIGQKMFNINNGSSGTFRSVSPGDILSNHEIRDFFSRGYAEYHWLGNGGPRTMKLTSPCRERRKIIVFNHTPYGISFQRFETLLRPHLRRLLPAGGGGYGLPQTA